MAVARFGYDRPGGGLAVGGYLRRADGGIELIEPAKLSQFGSKHAVILRKAARIVSLHIDDMAELEAHLTYNPRAQRREYIRPRSGPRAIFAPRGVAWRWNSLVIFLTCARERGGAAP